MKRILCFGDSNTWGLVAGTDSRYDWGTRWTGRLQDALSGDGFQVVEEGLCGRTTVFDDVSRPGRSGADLLPVLLEAHAPLDLVILMLGTNDCKTVYGASAEVIGRGVRKLIRQIRTHAENSRILLISPIHLGERVWESGYDPEFSPASVEVSKKLEAVYRRIAEEEQVEFLAASRYATPSETDQEHLNEEGHRILAEAIYRQAKQACA